MPVPGRTELACGDRVDPRCPLRLDRALSIVVDDARDQIIELHPADTLVDRVTSITQPDQASIAKTNYDVQGRLLTTTKSGASTSYGYDDLSRLNSHTLSYSGSLGLTTGLEYNPASQITKRTQDNDAYAFTGGYNSNRQYVPNGLNQYASVGSASLGYDANGNLVSDGATSYGHDAENRLVSASNGARFVYDPLGRLWQTSGGTSGTTQFLYHGDALVSEYGANGTM